MDLNSQSPFEITEVAPLDYYFVSRDGIKYHVYFTRIDLWYPELPNTYSFCIEPEEKRAHPIDTGIAATVTEILRRFFSTNEHAMIMVCDSSDGKELKRRKLFDRWFEKFSDESILKLDASASVEEYRIFVSIYFLKTNPNRVQLVNAFSNLLKTDLYAFGI